MYFDEAGLCFSRECSCGIRQKIIAESRLSFANIPENYKDISLSDFDITAYELDTSRNKAVIVAKAINYWLKEFEGEKRKGMGLYLYSQIKGSGKTTVAIGLANELLKKNIGVKFCTSIELLSRIKNTWEKNNTDSEHKLIRDFSEIEVLIIDDFGMEQADKPWVNEKVFSIINNRYVDKKITIFTSNKKLEELTYDDRISNRVKERVYEIPFPEESIRDRIAKNNMQEFINALKNS